MRVITQILTVALLCVIVTGCATGPKLDMNQAYAKLIDQNRVYKPLEITGPVKIEVEAGGKITMEAQMDPIKALPENPTVANAVIREVGATVRTGLAAWGGVEVVDKLSRRPTVVEPTVVNPEVVFVPEGG